MKGWGPIWFELLVLVGRELRINQLQDDLFEGQHGLHRRLSILSLKFLEFLPAVRDSLEIAGTLLLERLQLTKPQFEPLKRVLPMSEVEFVAIVGIAQVKFLKELNQEYRDGYDIVVKISVSNVCLLFAPFTDWRWHLVDVPTEDLISAGFVCHLDALFETILGQLRVFTVPIVN